MKILHLSDTHGLHHRLTDLPNADIIVHSGDISHNGTEDEVLDFLNWFISSPYSHKIFVIGNHDLCLWDAEGIENLPANTHFLQNSDVTINNVKFFGLDYNHSEELIPNDADIVVTHEPPMMILDESDNVHWGNLALRNRILQIKPLYHLFGHAHEDYGTHKQDGIVFSNAALLDNKNQLVKKPKLFMLP